MSEQAFTNQMAVEHHPAPAEVHQPFEAHGMHLDNFHRLGFLFNSDGSVFDQQAFADKAAMAHGLAPAKDLLPEGLKDDAVHNPPPSKWLYDASGHVIMAGLKFTADYDNHGALHSVTLGDQAWTKTGAHEVTFVDFDRATHTVLHEEKLEGVTKFQVQADDKAHFKGGVASAGVEIDYGGSSWNQSMPIYESPEHAKVKDVFSR